MALLQLRVSSPSWLSALPAVACALSQASLPESMCQLSQRWASCTTASTSCSTTQPACTARRSYTGRPFGSRAFSRRATLSYQEQEVSSTAYQGMLQQPEAALSATGQQLERAVSGTSEVSSVSQVKACCSANTPV